MKINRGWKVNVNIYNYSSKYATYTSKFEAPPTEEDMLETYGKSLKAFPNGSREMQVEEYYIVEGYQPDTRHIIDVK